jgi:hypothetical protein
VCSQRELEDANDAMKGCDVFNEKPPPKELLTISEIGNNTTSLPENVVWNHFVSSICCPKLLACNGVVYGSKGFEVN